jgi:hypothetical protein
MGNTKSDPCKLIGAVLLGLTLAGCPDGGSTAGPSGSEASELKLGYDAPGKLEVGSTVQLRLSFAGDSQYMMGALIDPPQQSATRWFADPPDAVEFDAESAQVRLVRSGRVRIRASYTHQGRELVSNELDLEVHEMGRKENRE